MFFNYTFEPKRQICFAYSTARTFSKQLRLLYVLVEKLSAGSRLYIHVVLLSMVLLSKESCSFIHSTYFVLCMLLDKNIDPI